MTRSATRIHLAPAPTSPGPVPAGPQRRSRAWPASAVSIAPNGRSRSPLALWHLLSLDAPTVAALWTIFIAGGAGTHLPATTPLAMAVAVWMLYAADRLLDARALDSRIQDTRIQASRNQDTRNQDTRIPDSRNQASWRGPLQNAAPPHLAPSHPVPSPAAPHPTNTRLSAIRSPNRGPQTLPRRAAPLPAGLEARHLFHHRHRRAFLFALTAAALVLGPLLPHLSSEAIRLDLLLGGLLFAYFILIHVTGNPHRLPKEFAVGIFFSAAVFVPTVARHPGLRLPLLPQALLFAALCTLNCLFIYAWEHGPDRAAHLPATPHGTTRLALTYLRTIALILLLAALLLGVAAHRQLPFAVALSIGFLLLLDLNRSHLSSVHLRACADLALLTPILFLPFLPA